jgi:hypothetical protein
MSLRNPAGKYRLAVINVNSQEDTGSCPIHATEFRVSSLSGFWLPLIHFPTADSSLRSRQAQWATLRRPSGTLGDTE